MPEFHYQVRERKPVFQPFSLFCKKNEGGVSECDIKTLIFVYTYRHMPFTSLALRFDY
jgi:hypothetical protein